MGLIIVFVVFNIFQDGVLRKISEEIESELICGLERGAPKSSIAMLPSFVPALPDGNG